MVKFRWEKNEKLFSPPIFPSKTLENTLFYCIFAPFRAVLVSHETHTTFRIVPRETYVFDTILPPFHTLFWVILSHCNTRYQFLCVFGAFSCGFRAVFPLFDTYIRPFSPFAFWADRIQTSLCRLPNGFWMAFAYLCVIQHLPATPKPHFSPFSRPCFYHTKGFCHIFAPSTYHLAVVFEWLWAILRGFRGDFDHLFVCVFWPLLQAVWRCCFISIKHTGWLVCLIVLTFTSECRGVCIHNVCVWCEWHVGVC